MKQNILTKIGLIVLLGLAITSCKKWIDTDINTNPNAPNDVPMSLLLPSVEANLAFTAIGGNDIVRTTAIWTQQLTGIARQSQSEGSYTLRQGDVNNLWGTSYFGTLMDANQMILKAQTPETRSSQFEAVGKILTAICYASMTDVWGDLPQSEALQGNEIPQPAFDSQEAIYSVNQALLSEGISILETGDPDDIFTLDGDPIFGGNTELWIKAAYAFKARLALQLSKRNGNEAYSEALGYLDRAISSNAENMLYNYAGNPNDGNPFWLFMVQREDVRMGYFFIELLKENNDPRLTVLAEPISDTLEYDDNIFVPGDYVGSKPDDINQNVSFPGTAIAAPDAPTPFITYPEMLFIKAEAEHQTNVDAKASLKAAVAASLEYYGVTDEDWLTEFNAKVDGLSGADLFKEIMTQKYIALAYSNSVFNDFRRTDNVIGLTRNPLGAGEGFPRRFPYAADPVTFNQNTPPDVDVFDRVWWDN